MLINDMNLKQLCSKSIKILKEHVEILKTDI